MVNPKQKRQEEGTGSRKDEKGREELSADDADWKEGRRQHQKAETKREVSERRAVATRSMRNLADDPLATAPGSDTQFHALGVMMALKKISLHDLSNFGSAFDYMVKAGPKTRSKNVTEN